MPSLYTASVVIGGSYPVNDLSIMYFGYKVMWDKGSRLDLLIEDGNAELQAALESMTGNPTPTVEFQLAWDPSKGREYYNQGSKHKLYILKAGMVTTPSGLALRIKAVDLGSILLRAKTVSYFSGGVKASDFIKQLCLQAGVDTMVTETGDTAYNHRALQVKPIDHIRYELDRVLSINGKPISIQFSDNSDSQFLDCSEELYDQPTKIMDTLSNGQYTYGAPVADNNGVSSGYNTTVYHFEMDQDFKQALWGHQVDINHLTNRGEQVSGSVKAKMASSLGIQGGILTGSTTRLQLPASDVSNPTSDSYFANSIMVNTVFHSEMSITQGYALIDPDFKGFDDVSILNRNHLLIGVTGGDNRKTGNAIVPQKSVVMGYEHRLNRMSGYTKVFVRRG